MMRGDDDEGDDDDEEEDDDEDDDDADDGDDADAEDNDHGDNDNDSSFFEQAMTVLTALGVWPKCAGAEPLRCQRSPGSARVPSARPGVDGATNVTHHRDSKHGVCIFMAVTPAPDYLASEQTSIC